MLNAIVSIGALQVLMLVVGVFRGKALALLLGPAGFGVVATIDQLVQSLAQLSNLSVPFTAMKYLSHGHSTGAAEYERSYRRFLRTMLLLAAGATVLAQVVIPRLLHHVDAELVRYTGLVRLALWGLPATMLLPFFVNVTAARQRSTRSMLLQLLSVTSIAVAGIVGCSLAGLDGLYWGAVPAATAVVVAAAALVHRVKTPAAPERPPDATRTSPRGRVARTAALTYVAVACYAVLLLVARYVSLTSLGETAAGLLQAALAAGLSIGAVLGPANTLFLAPRVNRALPVEEKIALTHQFVPRMFILFCLAALPVLAFPALTVRVLYSARFLDAVPLLPWFIVWQALLQVANIYQQMLIGVDDVAGACGLIVLTHLTSAGLSLLFVGPFGLPGIAGAFVAGGVVGLVGTLARAGAHGHRFPIAVAGLIGIGAFGLVSVSTIANWLPAAGWLALCARLTIVCGGALVLALLAPADFRAEVGALARRSRSH